MRLGQWLEDAALRLQAILDGVQFSRRLLLYSTLYVTFDSYRWCIHFAATSERPGADIAMIIGAVLAAVSGLQGYVFKAYLDGRP